MSRGVNKVILIGNLGAKPEYRVMDNKRPVANFSVATREEWKDKESGEKRDKTEWHRVSFFGPVADIAKQYLDKGSKVYVEGKLQTRKWQDKEGNDRWTTEIIGNELTMLGSKETSDTFSESNQTSDTPFPEDDSGPGITDDDIPFD